jgi:hypothetical protein
MPAKDVVLNGVEDEIDLNLGSVEVAAVGGAVEILGDKPGVGGVSKLSRASV